MAVYDDGHGWCFGCREVVIEPENRVYQKINHHPRHRESKGSGGIELQLPDDYTTDIPVEGLQWLGKYTLTQQEIRQNRIGWSPNGWTIRRNTPNPCAYAPLMILPVFDLYDNLLMYQARYFGVQNDLPKYWTVGNRGVLHILGAGETIVLVEDLISAIKVSRFRAALPIFGSDIPTELIIRLYNRFKDLVIWLDKDKQRYAHQRAASVRYMFNSVRVIDSEVDPKEHTNQELKELLNVND